MLARKKGYTANIYQKILRIIDSKWFFWGVVLLFVLQAAWIALSFIYPSPYDEKFHLGVIEFYTHQFSPIITNQDPSYDYLRDLTHESSHLFHYLMSFPYRLIREFVSGLTGQVVILRLMNILFAAGGLVLFSRLFRQVGIKQRFINVALLIFISLPIVTQVAATINYDNLLFFLTPLYLMLCVKFLKDKTTFSIYNFMGIVAIGCLAALVKYTFLPVLALSFLYLGIVGFKRRQNVLKSLKASGPTTKTPKFVGLSIVLLAVVGLFSQVYIQNIIRFGTPQPECQQSMSRERCLSSDIVARNIAAEESIEDRELVPPVYYGTQWLHNMHIGATLTFSHTVNGPREMGRFLSIYNIFFVGTLLSVVSLLYSWRSIKKDKAWYFLLSMAIGLIVVVFIENYSIYHQFHRPLAIQPKYLLSILPILIVLSLVSANFILRKSPALKVFCLGILVVLLSQGGGLVTHILQSNDTWYWQNSKVIEANHKAKKVLGPLLIIETRR